MKTSLIIEDSLFVAAKKEAQRSRQSLSKIIVGWARLGRESLKKETKKKGRYLLKPVNLGGRAHVEINSRRDWMDILDT